MLLTPEYLIKHGITPHSDSEKMTIFKFENKLFLYFYRLEEGVMGISFYGGRIFFGQDYKVSEFKHLCMGLRIDISKLEKSSLKFRSGESEYGC